MSQHTAFTISPHWGEFIIEDFLLLLLAPVGFVVLGLGDFPFRSCLVLLMAVVTLYLLYRYKYITTIHYTVGTEQFTIERGIISTRRDFIEMYRIVDYYERRTVLHRLLGIKAVTIFSTDRTQPCVTLLGIPEALDIVQAIRERVEYNKQRKGIYEITNR